MSCTLRWRLRTRQGGGWGIEVKGLEVLIGLDLLELRPKVGEGSNHPAITEELAPTLFDGRVQPFQAHQDGYGNGGEHEARYQDQQQPAEDAEGPGGGGAVHGGAPGLKVKARLKRSLPVRATCVTGERKETPSIPGASSKSPIKAVA